MLFSSGNRILVAVNTQSLPHILLSEWTAGPVSIGTSWVITDGPRTNGKEQAPCLLEVSVCQDIVPQIQKSSMPRNPAYESRVKKEVDKFAELLNTSQTIAQHFKKEISTGDTLRVGTDSNDDTGSAPPPA